MDTTDEEVVSQKGNGRLSGTGKRFSARAGLVTQRSGPNGSKVYVFFKNHIKKVADRLQQIQIVVKIH